MMDFAPTKPLQRPGVVLRLVMPIVAVLAGALGLIVATVVWTSEGANGVALERQRGQFVSALHIDIMMRASQLAGLTVADELWGMSPGDGERARVADLLSDRASDVLGIHRAVAVTRQGTLVREAGGEVALDGGLSDVVLALAKDYFANIDQFAGGRHSFSAFHARELATGRLIWHDGNVYQVLLAPMAPPASRERDTWLTAVGLTLQTSDSLETLGRRLGVEGLTISSLRDDQVKGRLSLPVFDAEGLARAALSFQPYLPGDIMRERLLPISIMVLLAAIGFCGLILYHVQKVALDLAQSEERARRLLGHDPLSGLPNRLLFSQRLDQELARTRRGQLGLAVMFLDLDRFKVVNDTHGHQAGDELIQAVARRLSNLLRGADTLARFGGDEFAIIQTGVRGLNDVEALVRRIMDDLTRPFMVAGTEVIIGCSIGIAMAPSNGSDRQTLMRLADTALYQSKNEGRNRFSFFERQMDETIQLRKIVEDDLRAAIANDELVLHYQPQVSADGSTVIGIEALVRWPHPRHGTITPTQFIAVAEERGLIVQLGEWVLRRACLDGARWPGLRVAVNVSAIQFRHKDFVASVARILAETGFDPTCLELELTEGVVVDDADAAEAAMMELRALGIHLALDDFGTGYSSLIYLRRFAFDKIKIDRSFLESMEATGESAILVHSIVHLGRALGLTVTAEGVETPEQHRFLQAVGCHLLQGYLFSRPVPAPDVDRLLGPNAVAKARAA